MTLTYFINIVLYLFFLPKRLENLTFIVFYKIAPAPTHSVSINEEKQRKKKNEKGNRVAAVAPYKRLTMAPTNK